MAVFKFIIWIVFVLIIVGIVASGHYKGDIMPCKNMPHTHRTDGYNYFIYDSTR